MLQFMSMDHIGIEGLWTHWVDKASIYLILIFFFSKLFPKWLFIVAIYVIISGKIRLIKNGESVDKISLDELGKFFFNYVVANNVF